MKLRLIFLATLAVLGSFKIAGFINELVLLPVGIYLLIGYLVIGTVIWITWRMWEEIE